MPYTERIAEALTELTRRFAQIADIEQAASLLSWDRHTHMPTKAGATRGRQSAALDSVSHEKLSDPRIAELLDRLTDAELEPDDSALVRLCRRRHERAVKLPANMVESLAEARSRGQEAWLEARKHNDFSLWAPHLQRMFDLSRERAEFMGYAEHPYDALHDDYEIGSSARRVRDLFAGLRPALVDLVGSLAESGDSRPEALLYGDFAPELQERFVIEEVRKFGYDFDRGRLDPTVHPFAQSIGRNDVRITTRYRRDYLATAIFATFHEAGHGMYEQGVSEELDRNPVGAPVSLGVHESQSRMWENLVGRSLPYWRGAYPRLQELFPAELGKSDSRQFYRAINAVRPTLIRIDADEVTYNLHVIARFELELAMLEGELRAADLPEAWNSSYEKLLGVTPPDDLQGCLQDVHWSIGLIGYFPTYTLGNLMSVQFFEAAKKSIPDLEGRIEEGDHAPLLAWLGENIHRQGSRFLPDELLTKVTGGPLDSAPYLRYLREKFQEFVGDE